MDIGLSVFKLKLYKGVDLGNPGQNDLEGMRN